jgi:hypothetical protein
MSGYVVESDDVRQRFRFARRRLGDIHDLNGGNFAGASAEDKHQLVQEFFFHLGAGLELAAQFVNAELRLGISPDKVSMVGVIEAIPTGHPVLESVKALYATPRRQPMPGDPYSEDGIVWRAYNYRHQVTHRSRNPFLYRSSTGYGASFLLDPRKDSAEASILTIHEDMRRMLEVFGARFEKLVQSLSSAAAPGAA